MFRKMLLAVLAAATVFISQVSAEETGILSDLGFEINGDASVYTQYIWRGFVLDRDAVIQPSFYIGSPQTKLGKLKIGVWSSQPLQNNDDLSSEEFDYIIDYTYDFDFLSASLGHTYYDFVGTHTFSREFYVGASFGKLPFTPSLYFYRDYGKSSSGGGLGNYLLLSVSHSIPIKSTPFSFDLGAHVGYNHNLFMSGDGGDVGLKAGVSMPLTKNLSFTPNVNYSITYGDLHDKDVANQKNRFFGGGTLSYSF